MEGVIAAGWDKLQHDWQSAKAHRRFITLCSSHAALGEAGRLYRSVRDSDPERAEEARQRLDAVMLAAVEQLSLTRSPSPVRGTRKMWLMVGACGFVVIYAVLALLRVRSQ